MIPSTVDYHARAHQHRPDGEQLAAEIRRLHAELGLQPVDLERALRVRPEVVADALRGRPGRAP